NAGRSSNTASTCALRSYWSSARKGGRLMAVARVTQVIGSSPHSWEDAVRNALERANQTLRGMTGPTRRAGADRMTALDAAFYHLERTGQLLHIGGVYIVEGVLDFARLLADVESRLHLVPRYTQRAVPVPFNLANPTWEPDPRFDLRSHVVRHVLRAPGDERQLASL